MVFGASGCYCVVVAVLELAGCSHCGGMKIGLRHGRQRPSAISHQPSATAHVVAPHQHQLNCAQEFRRVEMTP